MPGLGVRSLRYGAQEEIFFCWGCHPGLAPGLSGEGIAVGFECRIFVVRSKEPLNKSVAGATEDLSSSLSQAVFSGILEERIQSCLGNLRILVGAHTAYSHGADELPFRHDRQPPLNG
ncbi:hypothetical protein SAMN05216404_107120 [Nitrosospira multiformis]|uniref:Uncharacterized protein n=1 Tax=Nitrosospira multiformis TaxID=1231 RepID=A0A1H8JM34_9PROT|nr:hypothetical protein SAMN05216404_107120 [Nitrosospira multiformis]